MAAITDLLLAKGMPVVPRNTPIGFANDEHVRGRGFMAPVEHVGLGSNEQPAMPFVIDGARPAVGSVPVLNSWNSPSYISPVAGESRVGAQEDTGGGNGALADMRDVSVAGVRAA